MAPQKRKHPHDAGLEPPIPLQAPARRPTRQHPDAGSKAEHQLRSGRLRANTIEKPFDTEVERPVSRGRRGDAPKGAIADPAVVTRQTRTTRRRVTAEPEEGEGGGGAVVVSASKENVRPPTPPDEGRRRVKPLPKHSRHRARSDSPSQPKPQQPSPSRSSALIPGSLQQSTRPIPAATGSGPSPTAGTVPITPKRIPPTTSKTPKPPGTPRADRNIDKIIFGSTCFKAWYPSYYGKEILGDVSVNVGGGTAKIGGGKRDSPMLDRLYICPCCFKYSKELVSWWKHVHYCEKKAFIPGIKVYTHPRRSKMVNVPQVNPKSTSQVGTTKGKGKDKSDDGRHVTDETVNEGEWSVWEVDGEKEGLFCQNLSLFAKLFLDNKSVFFDVAGFNYFLLVYTPPLSETHPASPTPAESAPEPLARPKESQPLPSNALASASASLPPRSRPQIVGFFSKEKISWDNNNLACILVFPPWQRKGLGALLMGVSYEISRREGILGGPEKPISELGCKGYKRFWAGEIIRWILQLELPASSTEHTHIAKPANREEKEKDRGKGKVRDQAGLIVDAEQCSRDTWIVPEDCLAVLRDMGVIEETGLGPPRLERNDESDGSVDATTQGMEKEETGPKASLVPRVRIDRAAIRAWARENKIDLTRACDPDGFVKGYAINQVEDDIEEG